jgi:AcrR family transcriptional regulator
MDGEPRTKAALIEAAIHMFQQKGFQLTRVSDIVSAAGVSQGTFYNYFKSKEEIFRDICNEFISQLQTLFIERTEHLFDGDTIEEIVSNVHKIVRDVIRIYQENLAVAELLFREGIGNGGLFKQIYEDILTIFLALIEEQVKKARSRGLVRMDDPEVASVLLFGLFERGLFYFMLIRRNTDLERLEQAMVDFILNALSFDFEAKLTPHVQE